ncbi:hypothetical protein [Mesorhizobium sp. B2-1-3A]|uniref:hypothetical protein n=1 Tax=Mesorhizobium sp. B2-1-3A TaxID=2589971 RepID=UPI00112A9019|nr:hypothetical protein [Mesorhizobium sp. B2-1-3A]TPM92733.1 hypothetical protein FJ977_28035 [Mesorhizobium sp. B2-1-3A]
MRSIDGTTYAALLAAPDAGICERDFVTFYARSLDGLSTSRFCFWNDLDTVTASVLRGDTGAAENRDFVGDGSLFAVDRVPLVSDLTIQTVKVTLSQLHATVQDMVRGNDIRGARVEIHRGLFDPATHALAGSIYCHFVGKVNKAPISTPKAGDEGSVTIDVVSIVRELTRTNPAKKSDETQKRRSGDRFRKYSGVANVPIFWGVEKSRTK